MTFSVSAQTGVNRGEGLKYNFGPLHCYSTFSIKFTFHSLSFQWSKVSQNIIARKLRAVRVKLKYITEMKNNIALFSKFKALE